MNRRIFSFLFVVALGLPLCVRADEVPMDRLNRFAKEMLDIRPHAMGYPCDQNTGMKEFYEWYVASGLYQASMNNVGNPRSASIYDMNTHAFENEVIDFFAPLYGFETNSCWGIVTASGTDGNNHGMYFGVRYLLSKTQQKPIVYVSDEAHYSIKKLADVQNLELRLIPGDKMGHMDVAELERVLDPLKPALIVIAIGTTFKGAVDDQAAIDQVIQKKKPIAVYRHLDAALFGGYLPFSEFKDVIDRKRVPFDSIAVSGHKFFGFDEPMGFLITTRDVLDHLNPFRVAYLNDAVPTITCSRSAIAPLKFWWKVQRTGAAGFRQQAQQILTNAAYLKSKLDAMGYPAWQNPWSNTIFFKRPSPAIMKKYDLAPEVDARFGGDLAHVLVMQHVTQPLLDQLLADLQADKAAGEKINAPASEPGKSR